MKLKMFTYFSNNYEFIDVVEKIRVGLCHITWLFSSAKPIFIRCLMIKLSFISLISGYLANVCSGMSFIFEVCE